MDQINSEILRQFERQGLIINEGIAIDARLVQSANRPIRCRQAAFNIKRGLRILMLAFI